MTPDIQARLRYSADAYVGDNDDFAEELFEAADEISRLTSDLADLKHDMERLMESTTAEATENVRLAKEVGRLEKMRILWATFAQRTLDDLPAEIRKDPGTPIYAWGKITEAGCFEIYVGDFEKMAALDKGQRAREALDAE